MRFLPFIAAFALVLPVATAGLGHRTLWADEFETAERARAVTAFGFPEIYDSEGNLSLNTGGREIEEDRLHRYTPWLQFYVGAIGLLGGREFGVSPDAAIRFPFAILHALSSGIVAQGLVAGLSLHPAIAIASGTLYGFGSVRLIHDRTARYHALTDFLFIAAWAIFGRFRRRKRAIPPARDGELCKLAGALALAVGAVLHTQTLFGLLAAFLFGILFLHEERFSRKSLVFVGILGVALVGIFVLVRPAEQAAIWGGFDFRKFRSLRSGFEVGYAFYFAAFSFLMVSGARAKKETGVWSSELGTFAILLVGSSLGVRLLDFHPFSQTRYYLPLVGPLLFWPIAIGAGQLASKAGKRAYVAILLLAFLSSEIGPEMGFLQGLKIALYDRKGEDRSQPLREVFSIVSAQAARGDGVLMDYVPQAVNWYLPGEKPALIPDPSTLTKLGRENRTLPPMSEPIWHISYPATRPGFWVCDGACDYARIGNPSASDRYAVRSRTLAKTFDFCVVRRWKTYQWNNAPYANYRKEALTDAGIATEDLVLAKRCD